MKGKEKEKVKGEKRESLRREKEKVKGEKKRKLEERKREG